MPEQEFETTYEAARRLNLTAPTIRRYVLSGVLEGSLVGRNVIVLKDAEPDKAKLPKRGSKSHKKRLQEEARQKEIADIADEIL